MADGVLKAQKYLNAMFGGHKDWVPLAETRWRILEEIQ